MAVAIVGQSTAFSVSAAASVQLANKNVFRQYLIICNLDPANTVYICFGTNNGATSLAGIPIGPGGVLELGPLNAQPQAQLAGGGNGSAIPLGDVAAIAQNGTTINISYLES